MKQPSTDDVDERSSSIQRRALPCPRIGLKQNDRRRKTSV